MARKDTRHRSPHPSWPAQHLHHAHAVTTPLDQTRSPYARPSTPQETTLLRTTGRKACPGCPKEALRPPSSYSLSTLTHGKLQHAQDRCAWRAAVNESAKSCEANRTSAAEKRRQARKDSAKDPAAATIQCPHCPILLVFRARIGLTSNLRNHCPGQSPPPHR